MDTLEGEARNPFLLYLDKIKTWTVDRAAREIPQFKINKTFSSKTNRVTLRILNDADHDIVVGALVAAGADRKLGRAPMGAQERILSRALKDLGADGSGKGGGADFEEE